MDKIFKSQKRLKKYNVNRFAAWLLAVLMLFSALPTGSVTVHAEATGVAKVRDNTYNSLEEAIEAAGTPATSEESVEIKMLADISLESDTTIADYIALNLNGYTLDLCGHILSIYGVASNEGNVVDSSKDKTGLLMAGSFVVSTTNTQMPVYDTNRDGYVFATMTEQVYRDGVVGEDPFKLFLKPDFGAVNSLLASGSTAAKVDIGIHLEWTDASGVTQKKDLVYKDTDELFEQVYANSGKAFYLTATGVTKFEDLTITPLVKSELGTTWRGTKFKCNVLANGGFEAVNQDGSPKNWTLKNDATIASDAGKDGGKALYCNPTGTGSEYAYQQITNLVVGQEYIVTFWAKQKNAKKFLIKLNNENLKMEKTCTSLEEDWTEYSFTFEATGTTDVLNAQAYANSNNNCEVWFDNISVVKAETVESTASNLVADGGFENDGVWTLKNNATMESGVGRNNSKALYCNPTGTGSEYAYQQITNLVVGQEYIVTFWAKQKNAKKFLIKLDGETLIMEKTCTSTEEDWAEYSFTFKATATTVTFNVQAYANNNNCEAWFDDISIVEK